MLSSAHYNKKKNEQPKRKRNGNKKRRNRERNRWGELAPRKKYETFGWGELAPRRNVDNTNWGEFAPIIKGLLLKNIPLIPRGEFAPVLDDFFCPEQKKPEKTKKISNLIKKNPKKICNLKLRTLMTSSVVIARSLLTWLFFINTSRNSFNNFLFSGVSLMEEGICVVIPFLEGEGV